MSTDDDEQDPPPLHRVAVEVCENCLNGAAGQCHVPGCLFCRFHVEDTPQPLRDLVATPRVFKDGDTIPAGVCVLTEDGEVRYFDDTGGCRHFDDTGGCRHFAEFDDRAPGELCEECSYDVGNGNSGPLVEVLLPDHWAAVERNRQGHWSGESRWVTGVP